MIKWLYKPNLRKLLNEYLEVHNSLAVNTIRLTERAWRQMIEAIGDIRCTKFTHKDAEMVQAYWIKNLGRRTSARIYRKSVSPVFSWAVKRRYIREHPFKGLSVPKESKRCVHVYDPEELKRMLQACGGNFEWITILLIAITTGMRKTTIQNLTKDDIRSNDEIIVVREKKDTDTTWSWQVKDRDERELPLTKNVARLITELMYVKPVSQPYFLLKTSRYYHLLELKQMGLMTDDMRLHPITNFDRKFRKIKNTARVKGRFHDLRATCLTDLADVLNLNELAQFAGHSDIKTTMRYIGIGRDMVNKARVKVTESLGTIMSPSHAR